MSLVAALGFEDPIAVAVLPVIQRLLDSPDPDDVELGRAFDANADRIITLDELRASSVFASLMYPDVDTDGDPDGEALSIGVAIHATRLGS